MARSDYASLTRAELLTVIERLEARIVQQNARIKQLEDLLDKATRGGKRQAAPFSKGSPQPDPQRPGRKPGEAHGRHAHREVPSTPPDEIIDVPTPSSCPDCGGAVREEAVVQQHQIEIPRRPIHRRFDIHVGRCRCCGRRIQPRHALQTSDALGAAACQLGADAQAGIALMKNRYGLSYGDIVGLFQDVFGIALSPGGAARTVQRTAARSEPVYDHLAGMVRRSNAVCPDETGWKIGGLLHWLWDFVTQRVTLYVVRPSRGFDVLTEVLGADYGGRMTHDGWAPYDRLRNAVHQQCLAHLLRRARELLDRATRGAKRFPHRLKALLQDALALRDRRAAGAVGDHGLAVARGRLENRMDDLMAMRLTYAPNATFQAHLQRHRDEIFTFLYDPRFDATNWRAEQAIRPAVVNRKVFGGNRTTAGAHALEVLASLFATCRQHGRDALQYLSHLLQLHPPLAANHLLLPLSRNTARSRR
jgi:transposase